MLKMRDALVLAWTKLFSHKFWTSLLLLTETFLLAGVLVFVSSVRGFEQSLTRFNNDGLSGKYLVTASNVRSNPNLEKSSELQDLAEELYAQGIAEHAEIAERLGLSYLEDSEIAPTEYVDGERELVPYSPYAKLATEIMMENYLTADREDLENILNDYPYEKIFTQQQLVANGKVLSLENGKENIKQYSSSTNNMRLQVFNGVYVLGEELYQDYLFDGLEPDPTAIPVVVSVEQAEAILGMEGVGSSASSEELIQHFNTLAIQARGLVVDACYRNGASQEAIFNAQQILNEIERNQSKPGYREPSLIYSLPDSPCAPVTIQVDTRTAAEKEQEALQIKYQKAIGSYQDPVQQAVKFQIVGLVPTGTNQSNATDLFGMIRALGRISIATPLVSQSYYDSHEAELSTVFAKPDVSLSYLGLDVRYIIEFADASTARSFINEQSCQPRGSLSSGCATAEHRFLLSADNNSSLTIEDISRTFAQVLTAVVLVLCVIAVVFVAMMILRSITSDRKEIAIFRAIGFRQSHIIQIYLVYAIMLSVFASFGAIALSLLVGCTFNPWVSSELTSFLRATFLTLDTSITAQVFLPNVLDYLYITGIILAISLASALVSTLARARQNIIDGLRFE